MSVNRVEVVINSRKYVVLADETDEYINKLAEHIDQKVKLVLSGGQNVMGERPIILAALNICDEYFKCEEAGRLLNDRLVSQNQKLDEANKIIGELKNSDPQVSFEEEEALRKLREAEDKIKTLEARIAELQNNKRQNNNQHNNSYNNKYRR